MKKIIGYAIVVLIVLAAIPAYPANAQQKGESNISRKGLLKIRYEDLGTTVVLDDSIIDLKFKDRPTDESFGTSFTVMLEFTNISRRPLYLPKEINVYGDNAGFYDYYGMYTTEVILPGKRKHIPVRIVNTGHVDFRKSNYLRVFLEDSSYVRFPLFTSVHFFESDSIKALRHH